MSKQAFPFVCMLPKSYNANYCSTLTNIAKQLKFQSSVVDWIDESSMSDDVMWEYFDGGIKNSPSGMLNVGVRFKHEDDLLAFKMKFGV